MSRTLIAALAGVLVLSPLAAAPAFAQTAAVAPTTAVAETTLKKTIADIQAGTPDYAHMSPELAAAMKAQVGVSEQLKSLGAAKTFTRVGAGENPWIWDVTFESGMVLNWTISIEGATIVGLFVKPVG